MEDAFFLFMFAGVNDIIKITFTIKAGIIMKFLKTICVLCLLLCSFTVQAVAAAPDDKEKIIKDYYFNQAVNIAAGLCIGIYDPQQAPEIAYLRDYGWEIVPFKLKDGKVDSSIVVAKNYDKIHDIDFYVVGFRGSANKSDWKINLDTEQVPYGGSNLEEFVNFAQNTKPDENVPMVHKGFNNYVNTVLNATMQDGSSSKKFIDEIKNNPKVRVVLTGHSLGGAVATLTAERLVSMGIEKWRVPVITFGAPAIGNAAFAKAYGDKIVLWRITNTADPVPGSLQTFFGGYKQFGKQYKYSVSPKLATQQHDMAMYFDVSVHNYYDALHKAQDAGLIAKTPMQQLNGSEPLVAVWIGHSSALEKRPYLPDIQTFLLTEYQNMLPRYIIMDDNINLSNGDFYPMGYFIREAQGMGADYIIIAEMDGHQPQNSENWYINMNQSVFNANGGLVNVVSVSKLVSPVSGNMHAAVYAVKEGRAQLKKSLPFIKTIYNITPQWVRLGEDEN